MARTQRSQLQTTPSWRITKGKAPRASETGWKSPLHAGPLRATPNLTGKAPLIPSCPSRKEVSDTAEKMKVQEVVLSKTQDPQTPLLNTRKPSSGLCFLPAERNRVCNRPVLPANSFNPANAALWTRLFCSCLLCFSVLYSSLCKYKSRTPPQQKRETLDFSSLWCPIPFPSLPVLKPHSASFLKLFLRHQKHIQSFRF